MSNRKLDMSRTKTPTTDEVRAAYIQAGGTKAAFNRWLKNIQDEEYPKGFDYPEQYKTYGNPRKRKCS